jgi:hypothetical protein
MTSFSTYAVGRIRFVNGDLSTDDDVAEEQAGAIVSCLTAGCCRALLDTALDLANPDAVVAATDWHSPAEGWELEAVADRDRGDVTELVAQFFAENRTDAILLAERIAWDARFAHEPWHGDSGMGMYRVGMLLALAHGYSFADYGDPRYIPDAPDVTTRLHRRVELWWRWGSWWIDSTEEPCLLHHSWS